MAFGSVSAVPSGSTSSSRGSGGAAAASSPAAAPSIAGSAADASSFFQAAGSARGSRARGVPAAAAAAAALRACGSPGRDTRVAMMAVHECCCVTAAGRWLAGDVPVPSAGWWPSCAESGAHCVCASIENCTMGRAQVPPVGGRRSLSALRCGGAHHGREPDGGSMMITVRQTVQNRQMQIKSADDAWGAHRDGTRRKLCSAEWCPGVRQAGRMTRCRGVPRPLQNVR